MTTIGRERSSNPLLTAPGEDAFVAHLLGGYGDLARPDPSAWRGTAGVYRLWRDAGYVAGALLGGVVADVLDLRAACSSSPG